MLDLIYSVEQWYPPTVQILPPKEAELPKQAGSLL